MVMQKDPEDLFGNTDNLFAPDTVRSRLMHFHDEIQWLIIFRRQRVAEKREQRLGSFVDVI